MSEVTKEQLEDIMDGVGVLQNLKGEFEKYSKRIKRNKKYIIKESGQRKKELKEFKENYVSRFSSLDKKTLKLWSKIGDLHNRINQVFKDLTGKIQSVEYQISGLQKNLTDEFQSKIKKIKKYINIEIKKYIDNQFNEMKTEMITQTELAISKQLNENNKQFIKFQWVIISLVIALIIGGIAKFIMDWVTP